MLGSIALLDGCRVDNPNFHWRDTTRTEDSGGLHNEARPESTTDALSSAKGDHTHDASTHTGPTPPDQTGEDSQSSTRSEAQGSSVESSTQKTSSTENTSSTSNPASTTSSTDTTSTTAAIPAYCGTGPDLCYLIEDNPSTSILPNERASSHGLSITAGAFEESSDRPAKGTRGITLLQDGAAAVSSDTWQPPKEGFAFDLFVKMVNGGSYPRAIFGIKGRLILERVSGGGLVCSYNTDPNGTLYQPSGAWSTPTIGEWVHVICVYDGESVSIWLNGTSPFKQTPISSSVQFLGPKVPIQIGGDMSSPEGVVSGSHTPFRGSISGIRIWSDLNALQAATGYRP